MVEKETSLPLRGAWIEIASTAPSAAYARASLPLRGAWIEIIKIISQCVFSLCRSPCGERGLKYHTKRNPRGLLLSLPLRGAWIEIKLLVRTLPEIRTSLPLRGEWIEISLPGGRCNTSLSLPLRGAWIEILQEAKPRAVYYVAPPAGSVD